MTAPDLTRLVTETLSLVLLVSAPALVVSALVGITVALLQAATQVQDAAVAFVPKLLAVSLAIALCGGWMGAQVVRFTTALWTSIPALVR